MKQKILGIFIAAILILSMMVLNVAAEASPWPAFNVCCEKTKSGAWCQNTLQENCDSSNGLKIVPTSCDAASFCKAGCCYDSQEGLCMENTPQKVCQEAKGTWDGSSANCQIPQCELGCCVLGDQASFVTLTRCKRLSGLYGLKTDFRNNVADEVSCIAIAKSSDRGACVYEFEFQKTCKFTTNAECTKIASSKFYKDYLCSAEELATNCGPTTETMCIDGKDEVYFKDSCGNPANIYDASKINDKIYWKKIVDKSQACGYGNAKANAGSKSCGNCDYFKGSTCSKSGAASYGNYMCKDLNCYDTINGNDYKNGESWCFYDGNTGKGADSVGSRQYRHICFSGEELIEPCADYRNEVCYEGKLKSGEAEFREAACRVNRWKDCIDQKEQEDCENTDQRDCYWVEGVTFLGGSVASTEATTLKGATFSGGNTGGFQGGTGTTTGKAVATGNAITGYGIFGGDDDKDKDKKPTTGVVLGGGGICLANVPPGLNFWSKGEATSICGIANSKCTVLYEKGLIGSSEKCIENCECLEQSYATKMNQVCTSLGDCGAYVNWQGKFTTGGAEYKKKGAKDKTLIQGVLSEVQARAGIKTSAN